MNGRFAISGSLSNNDNTMRITFMLPSDSLTGGTRVVAIYARELQALGHDVLVVTCAADAPGWRQRIKTVLGRQSSEPPAQGHVAQSGVPHKVMPRTGPITAADVPDADVIVATWWETAVWMDRFPASKGRKVHLIQGYEIWFGAHYASRVHAALKLPNLKIAISRDLKGTIEAALGPLSITVIPNAVDLDQFNAPPRRRNATPVVGFVYATASIKGADICIAACALARQQLPGLRVIAFGVDRPTAALPLPEGAVFTHRPAQHALRDHYSECDAWLFGSRLDSFGLPMLEAMACRTPVIAVPIGAAEDLMAGGGGVLVPKESPAGMASALVEMCTQPEAQWQQRSDQAYATAQRYSWHDATRRFIDAIGSAPEPKPLF